MWLILCQGRDAGRLAEIASRIPTRRRPPTLIPPTGPSDGADAHTDAHAELTTHTAAGIQGMDCYVALFV